MKQIQSSVRDAQHSLDDVVVAMQEQRTAVAQMREHRQAGIDAAQKLLEARIAVPGRNDDLLPGQPTSYLQARVVFRREGHDPHEPLGGVDQRFIASTSAGRIDSGGWAPA